VPPGYSSNANPYFQGTPYYNGYTPSNQGLVIPAQEQEQEQVQVQEQEQVQVQEQEQPLNDTTVVARIQIIASDLDTDKDGLISIEELRAAQKDETGKYSKEDKAALQYILDNQNGLRGRLDNFDGNADGSFAVDTLDKVVADPNAKPEEEMSNTEALLILKGHLESQPKLRFLDRDRNRSNGRFQERLTADIDRTGLANLAKDESVSQEVRDAATKILENEELFKALDTGTYNDGNFNGHITHNDVQSLLNRSDVDSIGNESGTSSGGGGVVVQSNPLYSNTYPPVSTGNSNLDYYYNNVYNQGIAPATDYYNQAQAPIA
jgi:hypothetical protein